ncbi:hypothetical protein HN748_02335 [Candidatus Peregrinibacteria bacterium]|jgi:hypothetical protein|nr:hypothetical protein [Candidatus Peregrinibacteria bacterium]MBT7483343.1 hypothetical protein [Candidatus Peregrinibacteria bacterium]MBT7703047.1 hypothetical protein [Candidatus Peregrinibacteria bacterium]
MKTFRGPEPLDLDQEQFWALEELGINEPELQATTSQIEGEASPEMCFDIIAFLHHIAGDPGMYGLNFDAESDTTSLSTGSRHKKAQLTFEPSRDPFITTSQSLDFFELSLAHPLNREGSALHVSKSLITREKQRPRRILDADNRFEATILFPKEHKPTIVLPHRGIDRLELIEFLVRVLRRNPDRHPEITNIIREELERINQTAEVSSLRHDLFLANKETESWRVTAIKAAQVGHESLRVINDADYNYALAKQRRNIRRSRALLTASAAVATAIFLLIGAQILQKGFSPTDAINNFLSSLVQKPDTEGDDETITPPEPETPTPAPEEITDDTDLDAEAERIIKEMALGRAPFEIMEHACTHGIPGTYKSASKSPLPTNKSLGAVNVNHYDKGTTLNGNLIGILDGSFCTKNSGLLLRSFADFDPQDNDQLLMEDTHGSTYRAHFEPNDPKDLPTKRYSTPESIHQGYFVYVMFNGVNLMFYGLGRDGTVGEGFIQDLRDMDKFVREKYDLPLRVINQQDFHDAITMRQRANSGMEVSDFLQQIQPT